jgi:hypothetical protein
LPTAIQIFADDSCNDEQLRLSAHQSEKKRRRRDEAKKMNSSDTPADGNEPSRPLYVSIEMVANLLYLARHSEEGPDQQRVYLDRSSSVLLAMRHHPDLPK